MPIATLDDRCVFRVTGRDAQTFLQDLITQDMDRIAQNGIGFGALLSPQGKILFDFFVHVQESGFAIDLRCAAADDFARRLSLYKLRADVAVEPAEKGLAVLATWGPEARAPLDPRLPELGGRQIGIPANCGVDAELRDWHAHRVALGIPEGGLDFPFGELFPHDAAMDVLNGIDFHKGCFIGQEVISRVRHRGTARRRIMQVTAERPLPGSGSEITAGDFALGHIGHPDGSAALGVVRLDRLERAREQGLPVLVGSVPAHVVAPQWAPYGDQSR